MRAVATRAHDSLSEVAAADRSGAVRKEPSKHHGEIYWEQQFSAVEMQKRLLEGSFAFAY